MRRGSEDGEHPGYVHNICHLDIKKHVDVRSFVASLLIVSLVYDLQEPLSELRVELDGLLLVVIELKEVPGYFRNRVRIHYRS